MNLNYFLTKITAGDNLTQEESRLLAGKLLKHSPEDSVIAGAILIALKMKGETIEEILGFVQALRSEMISVPATGLIVDTCGTGGDGQQTFNISTACAFVVAGGGVKVAKHGNRGVSSLVGSADVMEELGINIDLSPKTAAESLKRINFTFLFAPNFHPALKNIGPVRRELKIRTIFNLLGPLLNPANVKRQLIGVSSFEAAEKLSLVVKELDYEHVLIIHSEDGLDEISLYGKTQVIEIKRGLIRNFSLVPQDFGLTGKDKSSIQGTSPSQNAGMIQDILAGKPGDPREIVLINSSATFVAVGVAANFEAGIELAQHSIDSGKALSVYKNFKALSHEIPISV